MPAVLQEIIGLNKTAGVNISLALQVDVRGRFLRLFIGLPIALYVGELTLPILSTDAFHFQTPSFTGRAVCTVSKDGYGKAVLLSISIVPTENVRHLGWNTECNLLHGMSYQRFPLFTDQGALLAMAKALTRGDHSKDQLYRTRIILNLHICAVHYVRSTYGPFKDDLKDYEKIIHGGIIDMSNSLSVDLFFSNFFIHLQNIVTQVVCASASDLAKKLSVVCFYGVFLLRVHPRHWSVFANLPSFEPKLYDYQRREIVFIMTFLGEVSKKIDHLEANFDRVDKDSVNDQKNKPFIENYLTEVWQLTIKYISSQNLGSYKDIQEFSDDHTSSCFSVFSTNISEGVAHCNSWTGGRNNIPPTAMFKFLQHSSKNVESMKKKMKDQLSQSKFITGIGQNILEFINVDFDAIEVVNCLVLDNGNNASGKIIHQYTVGLANNSNTEGWDVTITKHCESERRIGPTIETYCQRHEYITSQLQSACTCVKQILTSVNSENSLFEPFLKELSPIDSKNIIHFLPKCVTLNRSTISLLDKLKVRSEKIRDHPVVQIRAINPDGTEANETYLDCLSPVFLHPLKGCVVL